MCPVSDALRAALGIRAYRPCPTPRARVHKPYWHGARSRRNGHGDPDIQDADLRAMIDNLAMQHRLIRGIVADTARWRKGAS